LDTAIAMTIAMRLWSVVAGLVMVIITSTRFSPEKQGYYYTFNSLIGLQAFFELGLNFVLIQLVSHDAIHLADTTTPELRQSAIDRIGLLYRTVHRWFALSGLAFAILIGIGGLLFLKRGGGVAQWEWAGAWLLLVVPASFNLYFSPQLSISEGLGNVAAVARLRLVQSVIGYALCWIVLAFSSTLWALPCIAASVALSSAWWLHRRSGLHALAERRSPEATGYSWRREIFPLQWRIGMSWMSGYLLYQIFTPLVFAHRGAAEAAMIGLSLAMFSNIALISMSWLSATVPKLSGLVASGERAELKARFKRLTLQSLACQMAGCIGLCCFVAVGRYWGFSIMHRFLPTSDMVFLSVTSTANVAIFSLATFMRIHKEEPMLWNSVVCGLLVCAVTFLTSFHGAWFVVCGYMIVIVFVSLPWAAILFLRYWRADFPDKTGETAS
jgi:hypothetical protein